MRDVDDMAAERSTSDIHRTLSRGNSGETSEKISGCAIAEFGDRSVLQAVILTT